MSKTIQVIWNTMTESSPTNEEEVLIALECGEVTTAKYYENDGIFMNEFDQEWSADEIEFWMSIPKHPNQA